MERRFDTTKSMNYFLRFIPFFIVVGMLLGVFGWYKTGDVSKILVFTAFGTMAGAVMYGQFWLRYGNVAYVITENGIIKMRGEKAVKSIKHAEVEYFFVKNPEIFPRVRLVDGSDFPFPMTLGAGDDIAKALEAVGIRRKV